MKQAYIFSYGSLMLKQEVERTLHRPVCSEDLQPATLMQHVRSWTAKRANLQSNYKWLLNRYSGVFPEYIAYLNIEYAPHQDVRGIVFLVDEDDLVDFDRREVGYQRVDISTYIQSDQILKFPVYTYMDQDEQYVRNGVDVTLSSHYMNLIRKTCQNLDVEYGMDFTTNYLHQTYLPNVYLDDLDVVYFNQDFSQVFELRLDRQPMKICVAKFRLSQQIEIEQNWIDSLQVDNFSISGDWRQRFVLACSKHQPHDILQKLKNDPCMLVRLAFEYCHHVERSIHEIIQHVKKE